MSASSVTVAGKIKYKIVVLGDQHVGKTAIIDRFINDRFEDSYNSTIGIDFLVRNIVHHNKTYRLQLWDTAGQQRFKSLIPSYLKDSNCAVITFDLNSIKSLENAFKWLEIYQQHKQTTAFAVLVGNKNDIKSVSCTDEIIKKKNQTINLPFFSISAKTGEGVQELFLSIIDIINDKIANYKIGDLIQEKPAVQEEQTAKVAMSSMTSSNFISNIKLEQPKIQKKLKLKCC